MKTPLGFIVTFNPSPDFCTLLDSFYAQLEHIVLVDNGSGAEVQRLFIQEAKRRASSLTVLFNETNLGVAAALNQGFRWAIEHGYDYLLTFDQDSRPAPGMVHTMLDVFNSRSADCRLAVVGPAVEDPEVSAQAHYLRPKYSFLFEWSSCKGRVLDDVSIVITSGSLYDLDIYQQIGPFRDDFFIDYVDSEYCLRARRYGYKIVVACEAHLYHRLGDRQKRELLGRTHYPTFHSPLRWYYISRNRIPMLRQYALRFPHWFLYEVVATAYVFLRMLLFESQKLAKLQAFFLGTLDGIRGRMGKATNSVLEGIEHGRKVKPKAI